MGKYQHLSLREKPTVQASIVVNSTPHDGLKYIEYQPGNGSRYCVLFTWMSMLSEDAKRSLGMDEELGAWMATLLTNPFGPAHTMASGREHNVRPSMILVQDGQPLSWRYVQEKLGPSLGESDCVILAELFGTVVGRPFESCEDADRRKGWEIRFDRKEHLRQLLGEEHGYGESMLEEVFFKHAEEIERIVGAPAYNRKAAVQRLVELCETGRSAAV